MERERTDLEVRLARLERSQRRLRCLVATMIALIVGAISLGATATPQHPGTIVAESLHLVDKQGQVRILINPRAGVSLLDERRRPRAVLSVDNTGPGLALYGQTSKAGAIFNVNDDGPAIAMRDNDGNTRALLTTGAQGAALIMSDEGANERIALLQHGDQPSLSFIDRSRRIAWRAP